MEEDPLTTKRLDSVKFNHEARLWKWRDKSDLQDEPTAPSIPVEKLAQIHCRLSGEQTYGCQREIKDLLAITTYKISFFLISTKSIVHRCIYVHFDQAIYPTLIKSFNIFIHRRCYCVVGVWLNDIPDLYYLTWVRGIVLRSHKDSEFWSFSYDA